MDSVDEVWRELLGVNKRRRFSSGLCCGSCMDRRCFCGALNWDLADRCYICGKQLF